MDDYYKSLKNYLDIAYETQSNIWKAKLAYRTAVEANRVYSLALDMDPFDDTIAWLNGIGYEGRRARNAVRRKRLAVKYYNASKVALSRAKALERRARLLSKRRKSSSFLDYDDL